VIDGAFIRSRSFWLDSLGDTFAPRPSLRGDIDVDVAIVGAGYTGLWTAYYLSEADPWLRIAVLEAAVAGFGASGRNGGWCSAFVPSGLPGVARRHGVAAARALHDAMVDSVDEVGRVADNEDVDCHYVKAGSLTLATAPPHVARIRAAIDAHRRLGLGEADLRWLGPSEARQAVVVNGCRGAAFTPHGAALHPARLVRGLAEVLEEERLVAIYEETPVLELGPRVVRTDTGRVRADVVVRATEAFTPALPGFHRDVAPLYSLMIATEPLPASFWHTVGWRHRQTIDDDRHLLVYAQRTADDRIAMGGRGAPYHLGSAVRPGFDRDERVFRRLGDSLAAWFPQLSGVAITHRWGGPLAAARDWQPSIGYDPASGAAWAGGYVGDGVAAANLAGRTLAALITGTDSDLLRLPWVGHRSPRWEPEPLRWLAINGSLRLAAGADRAEARTGRPARLRPWLLDRLRGRS
jgi:glycine/D-amino acid oxidase-like deaminating enzyme